jgi:hypothetical protein
MKKAQGLEKPFFATFLENQLKRTAGTSLQGGSRLNTLKYPSDMEDIESQKYPSDHEDAGTKPAEDIAHTDKYPSDNDEDKI